MKKIGNIEQLKKWMINRSTDSIRCRIYGVQAYGISKHEYNVIVEFAKQGGRYYFIDRDGNRFLASRYEDAERVAGEIIENVQAAFNVAIDLTREFMTTGKVNVDSELIDLFLELCDVSGLEYESRKFHVTDDGDSYTTYTLKGDTIKAPEQTAQTSGEQFDGEQIDETAADEQGNENDEQDNENSEQDNENGETAAACEPSKLAGILAKVKSSARKVCEKVALIMALAVVMVVTFATLFSLIYILPDLLDLFGIECGSWAAVALSLLLFCTVIIDACVFVELNTMAAIDYFFPSLFGSAQKPGFTKPFPFWYRLVRESL